MFSGCQGLFRIAPSASKLKKLKASLDCGVLDVQEFSVDPHAIAGEIPTPRSASVVMTTGPTSPHCCRFEFPFLCCRSLVLN